MNTPKLIVITGGPGVGKSTLLRELACHQFNTVPEVARQIVKEQLKMGGDVLPWDDKQAFADLMLARSITVEDEIRADLEEDETVFFDRGMPDILSYVDLSGLERNRQLLDAVEKYPYHKTVFILPPWQEIYVIDEERMQDFSEAQRTDDSLRKVYKECGYEIIEVPRVPVGERAEFIMKKISIEIS